MKTISKTYEWMHFIAFIILRWFTNRCPARKMRIYNVKEKRKQNKSILAVFAEFERDIIQKRTEVGLKVAKKRGKIGSHL